MQFGLPLVVVFFNPFVGFNKHNHFLKPWSLHSCFEPAINPLTLGFSLVLIINWPANQPRWPTYFERHEPPLHASPISTCFFFSTGPWVALPDLNKSWRYTFFFFYTELQYECIYWSYICVRVQPPVRNSSLLGMRVKFKNEPAILLDRQSPQCLCSDHGR